MKKTTLMMALFAALAVVFTGCKDEEIPAIEYKTQGSIKGSLVGKTSEGDDLDEKFSYSQYTGTSSYYISDDINGEDFYSFTIERGDVNKGGYASISFILEEKNSSTSLNSSIDFGFRNETKDKIFFFNLEDNNNMQVSDITFDENSGRLKGKYKVTTDQNTSGKSATITGEIDVVVKKAIQ